jgi:hypothetical protein
MDSSTPRYSCKFLSLGFMLLLYVASVNVMTLSRNV